MHTCKLCGKLEHAGYIKDTKERLIANAVCFDCDFWDSKLKLLNDPKVVRIKGFHYSIGPATGCSMLGFGGRLFRIKFFDGRIVETNNLWCQGEIPERFREALPDNARFATT